MPEHQQTQKSTESKTTFQKQATPTSQTPVSNPYFIIQRARINPKSLTHADVMQLQRTIGNKAVGRLLSGSINPSIIQQARHIPPTRPLPPIPGGAAAVAIRAADPNSQLYNELSAEMCWDAVTLCIRKAGIVPAFEGNNLVSVTDELVRDVNLIPKNNVIGFFNADNRLIHVMLSLGSGLAAGNKNSCIGIGNPVGWEILNLNNLGFVHRVEDTTFEDSSGNQWDVLDSGKSQTSLSSRQDGTFIEFSNQKFTVRHRSITWL